MQDPKHLLRDYMWAHKWLYAFGFLCIVVSEFVSVQFPNIIGQFTDRLQAHQLTMAGVLHYVGLLFIVGAGYVVLYGFGQMSNGRLGRIFEYQLRKRLFEHWELLPTAYFRKRSIGDLLNHAMTDVQTVREALSQGLNILTNALFLLAAALVMTFRTVSVKLTLVSIIPLLFLPVFIIWWGPKIRDSSRRAQEALSDMAELTEESLTAIRLIKATANEDVEALRFTRRVDEIVRRQMGVFRKTAMFQSVIPFLGSLSFAIALLYGGYLTITRQIQLGGFVAFTLYLGMIMQPLQQLGFVFNNFQRASASLLRLGVLFSELPSITDPEHPIEVQTIEGAIEVRLPSFQYEDADVPTLQDVAFSVQPGQTLGIVGRTGAGKTTLVNLFPRIFDPPPGTVFIDGHDVRDLALVTLREAIAYVPQDGFLFSTTIRENIGFSKEHPTDEELLEAARHASFLEEIETFPDGLDTVVGERGVSLSGGQKQRAAIARAFLKNAPILILDDSLSAVDMNTEKRIIASIDRLRKGKTNIIIAHRLSAVRHADQIIVLDGGRVVERGTHESLLAAGGIYASMVALQAGEGVTA